MSTIVLALRLRASDKISGFGRPRFVNQGFGGTNSLILCSEGPRFVTRGSVGLDLLGFYETCRKPIVCCQNLRMNSKENCTYFVQGIYEAKLYALCSADL